MACFTACCIIDQNSLFIGKDKLARTNSRKNSPTSGFAETRAPIFAFVDTNIVKYSKDNLHCIIQIILKAKPPLAPVIATPEVLQDK